MSRKPRISYLHDSGRTVIYLTDEGRVYLQLRSTEDLTEANSLLEAVERLSRWREENKTLIGSEEKLLFAYERPATREAYREFEELSARAAGFDSYHLICSVIPSMRLERRKKWLEDYREKVFAKPSESHKLFYVSDASTLAKSRVSSLAVSSLDPKGGRLNLGLARAYTGKSHEAEFLALVLACSLALEGAERRFGENSSVETLASKVEVYSDSHSALSLLRRELKENYLHLSSFINSLELYKDKRRSRLMRFMRELFLQGCFYHVSAHRDRPVRLEEELSVYSDQAARIFNNSDSSLKVEIALKAMLHLRRGEDLKLDRVTVYKNFKKKEQAVRSYLEGV